MCETKGWNNDVELLLKNWSKQILINEKEYRNRGYYYKKWYYGIGVFMIVSQTSVLSTLFNSIFSDNEEQISIIFVTIMEFIILIVQGIDKFFNFGSASEQFFEASKNHNVLNRLIDTTLILPRPDRDAAREVLLSIRHQFNQLQDDCPPLPAQSIIHDLDLCIYQNPVEAKGKHPYKKDLSRSNSITIDIPESPPEDKLKYSCDYVKNSQLHKFNEKLNKEKRELSIEESKKGGISKNLEYQWNRLQHHEENYKK